MIKKYSNDDITIVWQPDLCIHSCICWKELLQVFNPDRRPWIDPHAATTERIIGQIDRCPTDALTYYYNDQEKNKQDTNRKNMEHTGQENIPQITVAKNGPLIIQGPVEFTDRDGNKSKKEGTIAICRCGATKNQPYCDGSHISINFKDGE